ncbi:IS30-like element ISBlo4 family transposase [Streptomyces lavendulae subsp. grasserius]
MPRFAPDKMPTTVKKRYFELLREGSKGAAAARVLGVSASCGSNWFIEAGSMTVPDPGPVSPRFLTQNDRIAIADGLQVKQTVKEIAASIGKSFQTVYREIKRNAKPDGSYHPWWAHNQTCCGAGARRKRRSAPASRYGRWSARSSRTSGRPSRSRAIWPASTPMTRRCEPARKPSTGPCSPASSAAREAKLRTGRTRRNKQRRGVPTLNKIKNMTLIHERPAEVNDPAVPGHWEGDLITGRGQGSVIGTLVERTTRHVHLIHLPHGWKAPQVRNALITQTAQIPPQLRRTLTWDQGRELTLHEDIEALTGFRIFFCDPHSPWQRGTNENTNGLLRQYFPKGTDLSVHTARDLREAARESHFDDPVTN